MFLIEGRDPPPPPPLPKLKLKRHRGWPGSLLRHSWRLAAGLGLLLLSSAFPPVEAYALILAACVLIGRGLASIHQSTSGLNDYRQ